MRKLLLAAALLALTTTAAHAQYAFGAALTASHASNIGDDSAHNEWLYGPTVSFQHEHGKVVQAGFDFRASFLNGNGTTINSGGIGPRVAVPLPHLHTKVYGEFLIGANWVKPRSNSTLYTSHFDYDIAFGIDHALNKRITWRVLEYQHQGVCFDSDDSRNNLSTGLLFHL